MPQLQTLAFQLPNEVDGLQIVLGTNIEVEKKIYYKVLFPLSTMLCFDTSQEQQKKNPPENRMMLFSF